MDQKERMLASLPYQSWRDGLAEERMACKKQIFRFNALPPDDEAGREAAIRALLGGCGKQLWVETPFRCDYGYNIEIGDNFYSNYNLVILDTAKVTIGKNAMFAPNVSLFTAGHPVHPEARNSGYEYGFPITIGDNVWLGGGVIVTPGVTIGDNVVVGAGSVVTRDLPSNVIAAGNPCRVIREIADGDRRFYWRDRPFDVEF